MLTIAACTKCGRGYMAISHEGVRCLVDNCGRLYRLPVAVETPTPEPRDEWRQLACARRNRLLDRSADYKGGVIV